LIRITGGRLKGRILRTPRTRRLRPSSARLRQALFSHLGENVRDRRVLDLFAGSGALGVEALSRGAGYVLFVEEDRSVAARLRANLRELGLETRSEVRVGRVSELVAQMGPACFDLVLADPPYGLAWPEASDWEQLARILSGGGILVLERGRRGEKPEVPVGWVLVRDRAYGDARLLVFRRGGEGEHGEEGRLSRDL
jgi:16S rRNA (guanine966-N2)-methyltransferase